MFGPKELTLTLNSGAMTLVIAKKLSHEAALEAASQMLIKAAEKAQELISSGALAIFAPDASDEETTGDQKDNHPAASQKVEASGPIEQRVEQKHDNVGSAPEVNHERRPASTVGSKPSVQGSVKAADNAAFEARLDEVVSQLHHALRARA